MSVRITCTDCGHRTSPCRSQAQAAYAIRQHSCAKELAKQAAARRGRARRAAVDRTPKPCLHKRADHRHGTHACYVLDRCRCAPCSAANSSYEKRRAKAHATGRFTGLVDAQPTREHVRALMAAGIGLKRITALSGVSAGVLNKLIYGTPRTEGARRPPCRRITWETAVRLQAVRPGPATLAGGALVDATGTRRRVQALVALGWSKQKIADRLGMTRGNFGHTLENAQVRLSTARAVAALYEQLWDTPPAHAQWRDLSAYNRTLRYAREHHYAPPLAWADSDIDDPAAHPNLTGYDPDAVAAVMAGALVEGDEDLALALTRADRLECLRRGREAFAWHNDRQVCARLGLDYQRLAYDLASERSGRTPRGTADVDEIAVARIMAGDLPPERSRAADRVEAIRRLAAQGLPDQAIADRTGLTKDNVTAIRLRNGIASTIAPEYLPLGYSTVGSHRQTRNRTSRSTPSAVRADTSEGAALAPRRRPPAA